MEKIIKKIAIVTPPTGGGGGGNPNLGVKNPLLGNLTNMSGPAFFGSLISVIISGILAIGGIAFFIMLLIGGLQWITAGGDKGKLQDAQARISQAGIGLLVLFSIWAVINLLGGVFGFDLLLIDIASLQIK